MDDYVIGEPVRLQELSRTPPSRYGRVYKAAESLAEGEALPVEFDSLRRAQSAVTAFKKATTDLRITRTGNTVYLIRLVRHA